MRARARGRAARPPAQGAAAAGDLAAPGAGDLGDPAPGGPATRPHHCKTLKLPVAGRSPAAAGAMIRSGTAVLLAAAWLGGDAALGAAAAAAAEAVAVKPHIVFFLADDLGYNNIGYHNHVTLSPHIDEFFGTGLQLNHSFSHKWCAPTRAALMSGRLPFKTGLEHGSLGAYSAPEYALALSANFTLLPETLKKGGYTTHSAMLPSPQPTAVQSPRLAH